MKLSTSIVTAYAKAPQSTAYYERYKYVGVVLEVDKISHIIVNASATFMTITAQNFFSRLVVGTNLAEDITELLKDIENQYIAPSQHSLVVAMKIAQQRYLDHLKKLNSGYSNNLLIENVDKEVEIKNIEK